MQYEIMYAIELKNLRNIIIFVLVLGIFLVLILDFITVTIAATLLKITILALNVKKNYHLFIVLKTFPI